FGSGVKVIDDNVFRSCKKLEDISVSGANAFFTVDENGVLFSSDMKALRQYPAGSALTEYTIPDGVEEIGVYAFGYAEDLRSVAVPEGVRSFGESAFYGCAGLTDIKLPKSLTEIGGDSFRGCAKLSGAVLPDKLESIGYYAFYGCASLESVVIPDGVGRLGYRAFYGCENLAFAHLPAGITYIDGDVFGKCPLLAYVCSDTADCYAGTYAAENGLPYRACAGHHPILAKHAPDSFDGINLEYEAGAFDGPVLLSATPVGWDEIFMTHPECEEALAPNPRESLCGAFIINVTDSSGGPAGLNEGQKVRLYIPVPDGADYKKSRVCRVADETGSVIRSYVYKPRPGYSDALFTVPEDGSYFIIETDSFGPFIILTETIKTTISINGFTPERKEGYKTTMRFSACATLPPDGSAVHWFIDDVDCGTGESFVVRMAKESYTVQVKLIDESDGEIFAESEIERVNIQTGFWAKVLAFLRMIFCLLPDITQ
nr:leucine-rich repeat domain-containing protein [Clostridia bacterium]